MKNTRERNAQEGLWREIIRRFLHSCVLAWPLIDRASKMLTDSLAAGHSSPRFIPAPGKSEEGEGRGEENWKCCCGWSDYKKNFFSNAKKPLTWQRLHLWERFFTIQPPTPLHQSAAKCTWKSSEFVLTDSIQCFLLCYSSTWQSWEGSPYFFLTFYCFSAQWEPADMKKKVV